jgi:hypothetical protein
MNIFLSTVDFKARWRGHKSDMSRLVGKCCSSCEHWSRHHRANSRDLSGVEIYFLDSVENPWSKEDGYPQLSKQEERWMVDLGSLA